MAKIHEKEQAVTACDDLLLDNHGRFAPAELGRLKGRVCNGEVDPERVLFAIKGIRAALAVKGE